MTVFAFRQSLITLPSLQPAYDLFQRCERHDRFATKIYWHVLHERKNDPQAFDYMCFAGEQLVGMLNIIFFSEAAEYSILIDPLFRGQKIAKRLLTIAFAKLKSYRVSEYLLVSPFSECTRQGAQPDHQEIEMRWDVSRGFSESSTLPDLSFEEVPVNEEYMRLLADIHSDCFNRPNKEEMQRRFFLVLKEPLRKAFIAKNSQGEIVGKVHAREDFNRVCLHDVGILKAFRRKGYGQALMREWLSHYAGTYGDKPIAVEVLGDNHAALALYDKCGFVRTGTHHFFRFSI